VQNVRGLISLSGDAPGAEEVGRRYVRFMQRYRRRRAVRVVRLAVGYAAAVALLVLATWKVTVATLPGGAAEAVAVEQELYVPAGQRARITLPDGSTVWLNAGSTLHYPSVFGGERRVDLTGEAFFDVSHNPGKPFVVSTSSLEITALGTQFNVYSYPGAEYASAALVDGSISVRRQGDAQGDTQAATVLTPNRQLVYANGRFRQEDVDKDHLLWKEGIYTFRDENLEKIIDKLELYYDVDIEVSNPQILKYRYTGKFRQRDGAMEILRIIQKIHHFRIYKDETINKITLS